MMELTYQESSAAVGFRPMLKHKITERMEITEGTIVVAGQLN